MKVLAMMLALAAAAPTPARVSGEKAFFSDAELGLAYANIGQMKADEIEALIDLLARSPFSRDATAKADAAKAYEVYRTKFDVGLPVHGLVNELQINAELLRAAEAAGETSRDGPKRDGLLRLLSRYSDVESGLKAAAGRRFRQLREEPGR